MKISSETVDAAQEGYAFEMEVRKRKTMSKNIAVTNTILLKVEEVIKVLDEACLFVPSEELIPEIRMLSVLTENALFSNLGNEAASEKAVVHALDVFRSRLLEHLARVAKTTPPTTMYVTRVLGSLSRMLTFQVIQECVVKYAIVMYSPGNKASLADNKRRYETFLLGFVQRVDLGYAQRVCLALSLGSTVYDPKHKVLQPSKFKKMMAHRGLTDIVGAAQEILVIHVVRLLLRYKIVGTVVGAVTARVPAIVKTIFAFARCSAVQSAIVSIIVIAVPSILLQKLLTDILFPPAFAWVRRVGGRVKSCYYALRSENWFLAAFGKVVAIQGGNIVEEKDLALNDRLYTITGQKKRDNNTTVKNNNITTGKNNTTGKRKRNTTGKRKTTGKKARR
jgi:hypothetical protein